MVRICFCLFSFAFLLCSQASANIVDMTLTSVISEPGQYGFTIDGKAGLLAYCIDPFSTSKIGDNWTAFESNLGDLTHTKLGNAAFTDYSEAAWLLNYSLGTPGVSAADADAAMRKLLYSSYSISPGATALYNLALADTPANYMPSNILIDSPTPKFHEQEFMRATPEPQLIGLLSGGLLLIVAAQIYRQRRKEVG